MKRHLLIALGSLALASTSVHALDAKYRQKLERSGCTQVTEAQGCDINKTRAENAKAGFGAAATGTGTGAAAGGSPYTGKWVAVGPGGDKVADIQIDARERVKVNGKTVRAKRSDGALVFKQGFVTYTIQGDRRLQGEDQWYDADAKTKGAINAQ